MVERELDNISSLQAFEDLYKENPKSFDEFLQTEFDEPIELNKTAVDNLLNILNKEESN